jgi:hypothetical protein
MNKMPIEAPATMLEEWAREARINRHRAMANLPNLEVTAPKPLTGGKAKKRARNAMFRAASIARRGESLGAAAQWKARNNRKLSRIAVRN